ncbi:hypothetical protein Efla_001738 [Eimeria flavescens]
MWRPLGSRRRRAAAAQPPACGEEGDSWAWCLDSWLFVLAACSLPGAALCGPLQHQRLASLEAPCEPLPRQLLACQDTPASAAAAETPAEVAAETGAGMATGFVLRRRLPSSAVCWSLPGPLFPPGLQALRGGFLLPSDCQPSSQSQKAAASERLRGLCLPLGCETSKKLSPPPGGRHTVGCVFPSFCRSPSKFDFRAVWTGCSARNCRVTPFAGSWRLPKGGPPCLGGPPASALCALEGRGLHSQASGAAEAASEASVRQASALAAAGEEAPSSEVAASASLASPTEPTEGSYAWELLQYVSETTASLAAAVSEGGASAPSSSGWFVDWILALKLGLGTSWGVAFPAAGCLLRLLTLPIAIESERDRRQRQLVDPQFARYKEEMKAALQSGNTQEYQRLRVEAKAFLKKHGVSVIPTSLSQMLLLGLAVSFSTPAIKQMAADPFAWKSFAVEQPAWLESLALPDTSGLSAALCWLLLVSTMAAGWVVSAGIQRQSLSPLPAGEGGLRGLSSPSVTRGLSLGAATLFAFYSGTQLPAAALLFLVPAFGLQSLFVRLFRLRAVERSLHFVPEGLRPLQQTYVGLMERRSPSLVAAWRQQTARGPPGGPPAKDDFAAAAAGDAAATSRCMVALWRQAAAQRSGAAAAAAAGSRLQTWASVVAAAKQRGRPPGASPAAGPLTGQRQTTRG